MATPNFDFKGQFPTGELVSGLQRKAEVENQQKVDEFNRSQQLVKDSVAQASQVVSGMVAHAKDQQKQSFIKTLADSLAQSGSLTSNATPGASSHIKAPFQTASFDQNKFDSIHSATMLNPEKASELALKQALPDPSDASARAFKDVRYVAKDGSIRIGNYDGRAGQLIQKDTDPVAGYAPTARKVGFTSDGREVTADRYGNKFVTSVDESGQPTAEPFEGTVFPGLENVPTGFADAMGELSYSQEVLNRINTNFNESFVGPIAARAGKMSSYLNELTDDQRVAFYGDVAEYKNSIIKAITGAQMSEVEAKRIIQQIPNENASPKAFMAALKRVHLATNQRLQAKERALANGGYVQRGSLAKTEDLAAAFDEKTGLKGLTNNKSIDPMAVKDAAIEKLGTALGLPRKK